MINLLLCQEVNLYIRSVSGKNVYRVLYYLQLVSGTYEMSETSPLRIRMPYFIFKS